MRRIEPGTAPCREPQNLANAYSPVPATVAIAQDPKHAHGRRGVEAQRNPVAKRIDAVAAHRPDEPPDDAIERRMSNEGDLHVRVTSIMRRMLIGVSEHPAIHDVVWVVAPNLEHLSREELLVRVMPMTPSGGACTGKPMTDPEDDDDSSLTTGEPVGGGGSCGCCSF